jgi:hypothetical protein
LIGEPREVATNQHSPKGEAYDTQSSMVLICVAQHRVGNALRFLRFTLNCPESARPQNQAVSAKLVEIVRNATEQYQDVANATGYAPVLGCVSGPDHGAMGIHYVNTSLINGETLLSNGQVDATKPQALIYEPQSNGELKLVGVEFIILASALPPNAAPEVEGHLMQYIDGPSTLRPKATPNRYGLPAFFELHVWAWQDNPQGSFVDWNNHVTCDRQ